jgi:hypothetical protein
MSKLDVTLNVEKQVINLVDESGVQVGLEPQPKIAVTMSESGGGGGGSYTLMTDSEYAEFKKDMQLKLIKELPIIVKPEIGEQEK